MKYMNILTTEETFSEICFELYDSIQDRSSLEEISKEIYQKRIELSTEVERQGRLLEENITRNKIARSESYTTEYTDNGPVIKSLNTKLDRYCTKINELTKSIFLIRKYFADEPVLTEEDYVALESLIGKSIPRNIARWCNSLDINSNTWNKLGLKDDTMKRMYLSMRIGNYMAWDVAID